MWMLGFIIPTDEPDSHQPVNITQACFALLSRLTGTYALGQGTKAWSAQGGSFYLPEFKMIDTFSCSALAPTVAGIDITLKGLGLKRLLQAELEPLISPTHCVPTILSDPPYRVFDALFYWED